MRLGAAWVAMGCALAFASSAPAQTARASNEIGADEPGRDWKLCDGYGGPTLGGDGMTSAGEVLFFFGAAEGGDTFRKDAVASRESIAICDEKLANPLIRDRFDIRRASLLRAKATHQIAAGDPRGALSTLDLAEAVQVRIDEDFYRRSFGLGIDFVRAYALEMDGQREAARLLTRETWRHRPFSTQSALAAAILLARTGDREEALQARARLDPRQIDLIFVEAFEGGRWEDVAALFSHLVPPRRFAESPGYDFQIVAANLENRARAEIFWAARAGMYALALRQLGREVDAKEALAAARARLDAASQAIPPLEHNGRRVRADYLPGYAATLNAEMRARGLPYIEQAELMVAQGLVTFPIAAQEASLASAEEELSALLANLPEVEIRTRIPAYRQARQFFSHGEGWTVTPAADGSSTRVHYRTLKATAAVTEELTLLRAAQHALSEGKPGFVVIDRADIQHTVAMTSPYMSNPGPPSPDGYSVELTIVVIDAAASSLASRGAEWRVIDAREVEGALGPLYLK